MNEGSEMPNVKQTIAKTLVGAIVWGVLPSYFFSFDPVGVAQTNDATCRAAIAAGRNRLAQGRNLRVRGVMQSLTSSYEDYPRGRSQSYLYAMTGRSAEAVMASPQLMRAIAQPVIQNCPTIGMVSIGVDRSGFIASLGLFNDGKIDFFECVEPSANSPRFLPWGKRYCT